MISSISQMWSVTFASMAGVQRMIRLKFAEVALKAIKSHRVHVVLDLLAERVRQSRESSIHHLDGQILPFDEWRTSMCGVGLPAD
jgi:hypothetical protein